MGNKQGSLTTIAGEEYERLRVLGKGSYGKVYAMQHNNSGAIRVIKEMNKADIVEKGQTTIKAVSGERKIFSHLKGCPYVCKAYAATQDSVNLYMMLEFCPGGELEYHRQQFEFMKEADIKIYLAMLTYALEQMQKVYHVVHRDLKPENILLTEKGFLRLIDLNIAVICEDEKCKIPNPKGSTVGTMPYIAPEILRGEDHDGLVDFWSLGVIAFLLSTGRLPFQPKGPEDEKKKIRMLNGIEATSAKKEFKRVHRSSSSPELSSSFEDLVCRLLEPDPKKRLGAEGVRSHKFYEGFDWRAVEEQTCEVPIVPRGDQVNFHNDANVEDIFGVQKHSKRQLTPEEEENFREWDWVAQDQELPPPDPNRRKGKKATKK